MLRPLIVSFGTLTLFTGLAYPLLITGAAKALFPRQAAGSLIRIDGQVRGSRLIAQATEDNRYFWSRPSATGDFQTNARATGGSVLASSNPALAEVVAKRIEALRASDPDNQEPIPQDLVTASGSGLDPDISLQAARWQARRIAKTRKIPLDEVLGVIESNTKNNVTGGMVVRVIDLNVYLDHQRGK